MQWNTNIMTQYLIAFVTSYKNYGNEFIFQWISFLLHSISLAAATLQRDRFSGMRQVSTNSFSLFKLQFTQTLFQEPIYSFCYFSLIATKLDRQKYNTVSDQAEVCL